MWIWNNLLEETQLVLVVWDHPTRKELSHAPIARQRAHTSSCFFTLIHEITFCKLDNSSFLQFAGKQPLQKIFDLVQLLATHLEIVALTFIVLMWHLLSCILLPIEMSLHMIMFIFDSRMHAQFPCGALSLVLLSSGTWYVNESNSYPKVSLWNLWTKEFLNYDFFCILFEKKRLKKIA